MMQKIWLIFKQDLKNVFTNTVTFVSILVLLIVPVLFAVLTIKANWLPLNDGNKIKVALVNQDVGEVIDNKLINIGNKIKELTWQDDKVNWKYVSYEEAIRGLLIGDFYGMIVIPENFSEEVETLTTDTPIWPTIYYTMNIRENVFIPTFIETNSWRIQMYISHGIVRFVNEAVESAIGDLKIDFAVKNTDMKEAIEALLELDENKNIYIERLNTYRDLMGSMMVLLSNLREELPGLNEQILQIDNLCQRGQRFIEAAGEMENSYEDALGENAFLQINKMKAFIDEAKKVTDYFKQEIPKLQAGIEGSNEMVSKAYSVFNRTNNMLTNMTRDLHGLESKLSFLADGNNMEKLIYMLENDPELVKEYIAAPTLMKREDIKGIPNYGSSSAPFNIAVSMWIGTTILVVVLSTKFQMEDIKHKENITVVQEYFGEGLFFVFLGCIQDIITIITAKQVLGIDIENYGLFLIIGIIGSIAFTTVIYTLISVLGNVGRVITYVFSVLQFFFLGGVFSTQIIPPVLQNINKVIPFVYVIGSFREIQMGIITRNILNSAFILVVFILGSIIFGVIGNLYLVPYIEKARQLVKDSHLGN